MGTNYTTSKKVASLLQVDNFSDTTIPTKTEVENFIKRVEDTIDYHTMHAWRQRKVALEYHDYEARISPSLDRWQDWTDRGRCYLRHRNIFKFNTSYGDKLEIWDGSNWIDYIATYTEARSNDFWVDYERGIIHFANRYPWRRRQSIRVTYRYGEMKNDLISDSLTTANGTAGESTFTAGDGTVLVVDDILQLESWDADNKEIVVVTAISDTTITVDRKLLYTHSDAGVYLQRIGDIEELASKLAGIELLTNDDYSVLFPEGTSNIDLRSKAEIWQKRCDKIMRKRRELWSE